MILPRKVSFSTTLVTATLPQLVTKPLKVTTLPTGAEYGSQFSMILMQGVAMLEQVAEQVELFVWVYEGLAPSIPLTNIVSLVGAQMFVPE
jgi:hypothetical protein